MIFKTLLFACLVAFAFSQSTDQTSHAPPTSSQTNTTASTTVATTTVKPDMPPVLNFTLPKNSINDTCLKLQLAVEMTISYSAEFNNKTYNTSLKEAIPADYNDYDGECNKEFNYFKLIFWNNWTLELNYTLMSSKYELSTMQLTYFINSTWFPNASASGTFMAKKDNLHDFSANTGSSFKCNSKTTIELSPAITLDVTHYQGQPFLKDGKKDFDIAVECSADTTGTSKLVPIIVGSALAFLVVLVLIAYLIGRRRHRSGYQSV